MNHYTTKNEKYLKAKIKFYNGKISRRFRNNKIPTEGSQLFYIFFLHVKMANKYYQKHKEKLQKEARERYQNISEKEKEKKHHYLLMKKILMKKIKIYYYSLYKKKKLKYFFYIFFLYIKMSNKYYQKHKENLRKE